MFFEPTRVFFEEDSLKYDLGERLYGIFKGSGAEIRFLKSHNRVSGIPGSTPQQSYFEGKNTIVVGVRKTLDFETCKPSAHYQLPIVTGCPGKCEYCYLNTQLGRKPYIRLYVNVDEILEKAEKYIEDRKPDITIFEASATSDPLPVEKYTGSLKKAINFFGTKEFGRLRFVTKFAEVEPILDAQHNGNTTIRFSMNSSNIIQKYEHGTSSMEDRVTAAKKVSDAGYNLGFIVAPVFIYENYKEDYEKMLSLLSHNLKDYGQKTIHFEIISHRYTSRAKSTIQSIFTKTDLPMEEENRKFKFGQFGYGKYVYTNEALRDMHDFFADRIPEYFSNYKIDYMI